MNPILHWDAVYEIVLQAQLDGIGLCRPGTDWQTIQNCVIRTISQGLIDLGIIKGSLDDCLSQKLFQDFYMHNFGHWIGMDVHDVGLYKEGDKWREVQPGMLFTVEPGIYISPSSDVDEKWWNIGIRIEDDVLITDDGSRVLTDALPKAIPSREPS